MDRSFTYHDILRVLADHGFPRELVVDDDSFYTMLRLVTPACICLNRPGIIVLSAMIVPRSSWAPVIADPGLVEKYTKEVPSDDDKVGGTE